MNRQEMMSRLKDEARELVARTCGSEMNLVWGEGDLHSPLAIFGEAPGEQEDRAERPFVGRSGKLLTSELEAVDISRDDIYISNVVKCRPVKDQSGRSANRPPTAQEVRAWSDLLARELAVISPRVVLCLGAVAASALIHPGFAMKAERGAWFDGPLGSRAMATFHPSYVLRAVSQGDDDILRLFRLDLAATAEAMRANSSARTDS